MNQSKRHEKERWDRRRERKRKRERNKTEELASISFISIWVYFCWCVTSMDITSQVQCHDGFSYSFFFSLFGPLGLFLSQSRSSFTILLESCYCFILSCSSNEVFIILFLFFFSFLFSSSCPSNNIQSQMYRVLFNHYSCSREYEQISQQEVISEVKASMLEIFQFRGNLSSKSSSSLFLVIWALEKRRKSMKLCHNRLWRHKTVDMIKKNCLIAWLFLRTHRNVWNKNERELY